MRGKPKRKHEKYFPLTTWVRPKSLDKLSQETIDDLQRRSFDRVKQFVTAQLNRIRLASTRLPVSSDNDVLLESVRILNAKASTGVQYEIDFKTRTLVRVRNATKAGGKHKEMSKPLHSVRSSFSDIVRYFERQRKLRKDQAYDLNRLYKVNACDPDDVKLGKNEFKEYVVFSFEIDQIAVLECPIIGNAMYVLEGNWRSLLRLSKSALLKKRGVVRVIHDRELLSELQSLIKTRRLQAKLR
jgi:hypothetical protein